MTVKRLTPETEFLGASHLTVGDFWQWAYSDLVTNTNRGVLAEFLVSSALGLNDNLREEWGNYDLDYNGLKIEVKSAAYLQNWFQNKPSIIGFDIGKKIPWYRETGLYGKERIRSADCYVICLNPEKKNDFFDLLNLDQWLFYVLPTTTIEKESPEKKRIGLSELEKIAGPPVTFSRLKLRIDALFP